MVALTSKPSPITPEMVAGSSVAFADLQANSNRLYWSARDPNRAGRSSVQSLSIDDPEPRTLTNLDHNVRSGVHEYGGGAFCVVSDGSVAYTDFASHTVYWRCQNDDTLLQVYPRVGTTSPCRLADFTVVYNANQEPVCLVAVMEDHTDPAPARVRNSIVAVALDGSATVQVLASGRDFYASPRINPAGTQLAFVAWDHPNMPWDDTTLYVANVALENGLLTARTGAAEPQAIHGHAVDGASVSVYAPQWHGNELYFLSDQTGWYNLYRYTPSTGQTRALLEKPADFCDSASGWILNVPSFTFCGNKLVAVYTPAPDQQGASNGACLVVMEGDAVVEYRDCLPTTSISSLTGCGDALFFIGGSTKQPNAIWCWKQLGNADEPPVELLSSNPTYDPASCAEFLSEPELIRFPSPNSGLGYAYGYYYPPNNRKDFQLAPPLLVQAHGGPTSRTSSVFRLDLQFWTSRGYGVLDVDYGGSTGYGKAYRQSLKTKWGLIDVEDVCNGARYCVEQGWANPDWLCIDGRSAGGYTTLAALTFGNVFCAGASLYGVADLTALAQETHKFESRYLDGLIAPYPSGKVTFDERCPIHHTDQIDCPVILLQGDEDKIVPPGQAEAMFKVLQAKGLPSVLHLYKGEQHGFRKAENIRHVMLSEYFFFCQVFGIEPQPEQGFEGIVLNQRIEL